MQKIRSEFPEIEEIKQDIDSLKSNVVELTKHMKSEGKDSAFKLGEAALSRYADLKKSAQLEYLKAEKSVKSKPGQSIAIAFGAGLVAAFLLRGRK